MMKTIHDKNLRALGEDPDFQVEEIVIADVAGEADSSSYEDAPEAASQSLTADQVKEEGEDAGHPPSFSRWKLVLLMAAATFCLVCFVASGWQKKEHRAVQMPEEMSEEVISLTEAETDTQEETPAEDLKESTTPAATDPVEMSAQEKPEQSETLDTSWQTDIFGNYENAVVASSFSISGLTENEKNLTGFRESDFIRSLSAFLKANNLRTTAVTFTGSIACSAGEAAAYTANLKGVDNRRLVVLFYPRYPGKYLFTLEETSGDETKDTEKKDAAPAATTQSAPIVTAPNYQTQQSQSSQEQTEPAYDAMRLKLSGISSELGNYLVNSYELQYGLYDYLYQKGIKNAASAAVTDYYIDSADRVATIQIRLDGIGSVTAIYDRDENSYSFQ